MKIHKFSIRESLCARNVQFAHSRKYMRAKVSHAKVSAREIFFTQGVHKLFTTVMKTASSFLR